MKPVKLTCDRACDLSPELYRRYRIRPIPTWVKAGDEEYLDGADLSGEQSLDWEPRAGRRPHPCVPDAREYARAFREELEGGCQVVHLAMSGGLSSAWESACAAASGLDGVYVVDSRSISAGAGYLALLAAEMVQAGLSAGEVASALEGMKGRMEVSFLPQTLRSLISWGRLGGPAAYGAALRRLRAKIRVTRGKLRMDRSYRGDMEGAVLKYVTDTLSNRRDILPDRLIVAHTGAPEDLLNRVRELALRLQPFEEVLVTPASAANVSCWGPGCVGLMFMRK